MADAAPQDAPLIVRVEAAQEIAHDIFSFDLRPVAGAALPNFSPGAHVEVQLPDGLRRKYSLCNDPSEAERYVIAVRREAEGRGGSQAMVREAQPGAQLTISPPRNNFELVKSPAGYIFIAGGIGITPIMSMVRHLKPDGGKFKLYYCTRSPTVTAFHQELSAPEFRGQVVFHHDGGDPARALDFWPILERPKGQHVYCCGPRPMMDAVRDMSGHWPASAVHFEAFTEAEARRPDDKPFTVHLAQSGGTVEVPAGVTILEALRGHGLTVPSSCESGACGSCRTRLIAGEADHRDLVLGEHERATNIMVCVSRARGDAITIDR